MRGLGRSVGVLPVAVAIGSVVGLAMAGLNWLVFTGLLTRLYDTNLAVAAIAPGAGLVVTAAVLHWGAIGASPSTTDEYVFGVIDPNDVLDPYPAPARAAGVVATIGSGGALGLEGGGLYLGGAVGVMVARWLGRMRIDPSLALVAGGAAGMAALMQQPVFGALLAVEVPYRAGLDVRRLPVAMAGALAGWAVFALTLPDVDGLLTVGSFELEGKLFGVALVAGVAGGLTARVLGPMVLGARRIVSAVVLGPRLIFAVVALAVLVVLCDAMADVRATLGPGTFALSWMLAASPGLDLVVVVLVLRALASSATVVGGGCGGLFVPFLVCGGMAGRLSAELVDDRYVVVATVIGGAAALAAGYRIPLSAVAFVTATLASGWGFVLGVVGVAAGCVAGFGVLATNAQADHPDHVQASSPASRRNRGPRHDGGWVSSREDARWNDERWADRGADGHEDGPIR